jgi:hypothetical protein
MVRRRWGERLLPSPIAMSTSFYHNQTICPNRSPLALDQASSYRLHRSPTGNLGEATRLADVQPRSVCRSSPCFERVVGVAQRALQPQYGDLGAHIGRERQAPCIEHVKKSGPRSATLGKRAGIRETRPGRACMMLRGAKATKNENIGVG